jgi:hypothetical protein
MGEPLAIDLCCGLGGWTEGLLAEGWRPWVGAAAGNYGSFYLWGDVPALMPAANVHKNPGHINKRDGAPHTKRLTNPAEHIADGRKHHGDWFRDPSCPSRQGGISYGTKQPGLSGTRDNGKGDRWFQDGAARHGSKSSARKAASAKIAKIPLALGSHIARVYKPALREAA